MTRQFGVVGALGAFSVNDQGIRQFGIPGVSVATSAAGSGSISGIVNATLAALTGTGSAALPVAATGGGSLAAVTLAAAGALAITGAGLATLSPVAGTGAAAVAINAQAGATLAPLTGTAAGTLRLSAITLATLAPVTGTGAAVLVTGRVGQTSATLAGLTASAAATLRISAQANVTLGAVTGVGTAEIFLVVWKAAPEIRRAFSGPNGSRLALASPGGDMVSRKAFAVGGSRTAFAE